MQEAQNLKGFEVITLTTKGKEALAEKSEPKQSTIFTLPSITLRSFRCFMGEEPRD